MQAKTFMVAVTRFAASCCSILAPARRQMLDNYNRLDRVGRFLHRKLARFHRELEDRNWCLHGGDCEARPIGLGRVREAGELRPRLRPPRCTIWA